MNPDDYKSNRQGFSSLRRTGFSIPTGLSKQKVKVIYWGFVLIFVGFMASLVYFTGGKPNEFSGTVNNFYDLNEIYQQKGINSFINEKENLKDIIKNKINYPENDDIKKIAESIAVYLFPEILPDTHFEKEAAMTLWIPLLRRIEKNPGTREARALYEEAKTEIWNYENPDKKNPKLSDPARETLKIYKGLSVK